jgi:predicted transcriptional regulator
MTSIRGVKQGMHRSEDEIMRQILCFLHEHGPSSVVEIEYGVEINNGQTKKIMKHLVASEIITISLPEKTKLSEARRNRLSPIVMRLYKITAKGRKAMHLMNKIALPFNTQPLVTRNRYHLFSKTTATVPKT